MKELLAQGLEKYMSNEQKTNVLRENLQVMILKNLSDRGAFKNLSFVGGTALRIIHGLNRFSEDLDFSLSNKKGFDFDGIATGLADDLDKAGLAHTAKKGGKGEVKFLFMKFPGLLSEFGAGRLKAENLGVKIEVDMKPPEGWENETVLINRFYIFQVNCYKLPSLFAGKLHACLYRKYTKARDYYDLLWYLTKKVKPNYDMLSNAAQHSEKKKKEINAQNLPVLLLKKLESVNFKAVESDVAKFLNNPEEAKLLNLETFKMLLKNIS
jgi:predicted nucleotidyltransferase component of viral defense system